MMVLCPLSRRHKFGRRSSYLCLWNVLILEVPVLCFVNRFLINHFCFVMIVFFRVCHFDLIYPIDCLCGVNTRSFFRF